MAAKRISTIFLALWSVLVPGVFGCASAKYQKEVVQPMMIQENRQLEDELFYTREQLNRSLFENQRLRKQVAELQTKSSATTTQTTATQAKPLQPPPAVQTQSQSTSAPGRSRVAVPNWSPHR